MTPQSVVLDPQLFSTDLEEIMTKLRARTVGQDHAVEAFGRIFETFLAGYNDPERPIGVVLELGPTGVGKTTIVENQVSPSCHTKTPSRTRGRAGSIFNPRGCYGCRFPTCSDARSWLPHSLVEAKIAQFSSEMSLGRNCIEGQELRVFRLRLDSYAPFEGALGDNAPLGNTRPICYFTLDV